MSLPRFYCPQLARVAPFTESRCFLDAAEARHATSVLRMGVGSKIAVFDGVGREVHATILEAKRDVLCFEISSWSDERAGSHEVDLTLAIALPKGDRQKTLVDTATELGVTKFVPLICQRGVAQPTDSALERLRRQVIEACKQCGRNRLMDIDAPIAVTELQQVKATEPSLRFIAHPYTDQPQPLMGQLQNQMRSPMSAVVLAIGPEGGFTDDEVLQLSTNGFQVVQLGPLILRVEVAAAAAISQIIGWFQSAEASRG